MEVSEALPGGGLIREGVRDLARVESIPSGWCWSEHVLEADGLRGATQWSLTRQPMRKTANGVARALALLVVLLSFARCSAVERPSRPLLTRPRARIDVTWAIAGDFAVSTDQKCDGTKAAETTLTLFRCSYPFPRCAPGDRTVIRRLSPGSDVRGKASFGELDPGDYYVELERAGLRAFARAAARVGVAPALDLKLDPLVVTGRVTRGSKPVRASIELATGTAVSDAETGEYTAFLSKSPGTKPIRITVCGSNTPYVDIPTRAVVASDRYDIDIPANRLIVGVVDATTNAPLSHARVSCLRQRTAGP